MNTETLLRNHLKAAADKVSVDSPPVERIKASSRRTYVYMGMAAAALVVVVVAAVGLLRNPPEELVSPPPVSEDVFDVTRIGFPPQFDPGNSPAIYSSTGTPREAAAEYLAARIQVESRLLAHVELENGFTAVRWGWGSIAGLSGSDDGNLGWVLVRESDDGSDVVASFTDGVDMSQTTFFDGRLDVLVRVAPFGFATLDVLDLDGVPVEGAPFPAGQVPGVDMRVGTAGSADRETVGGVTDLTFTAEAIGEAVVVRTHLVGGALVTVSELALVPETTPPTTAPPNTTSTTEPPPTTTTTEPSGDAFVPPAWTEADAERDVENFLAALQAGAYEQAAWPMESNGGVYDGQGQNETNTEYLARVCQEGACNGPYAVVADGPGVVNEFGQAGSTVTVTHVASGEVGSLTVATFEGQRNVMGIPPLVPSAESLTMVEALFGNDTPDRVVVQRFDAFEIWEDGEVEWVTNWHANETVQVEGDYAVRWPDAIVDVRDPSVVRDAEFARLTSRDGQVLALVGEWTESLRLIDVATGDARTTPVALGSGEDGEWGYYNERAGTVLSGLGDAEGNLVELVAEGGASLIGDDYIGHLAISVDGTQVAYVDHRDPASYSHFWSPVVVQKDVRTGAELNRWVLDGPVLCLEFSGNWIVACEGSDDLGELASGSPAQASLAAINTETGDVTRVASRSLVFLPS